MYKPNFNKREVIVFRQFQRKGYSLFACLGRVVVIGVLSAAPLQSATAATDEVSTKTEKKDNTGLRVAAIGGAVLASAAGGAGIAYAATHFGGEDEQEEQAEEVLQDVAKEDNAPRR